MSCRFPFHLSIAVSDLETSERFYVDVLGACVGRKSTDWMDVLVWGHQITLQHRPSEVVALEHQGKRHFGVILPWDQWESEAGRIAGLGTSFLASPKVLLAGTMEEHAKFYLADPSHNVIEVKAYRDVATVLGLET